MAGDTGGADCYGCRAWHILPGAELNASAYTTSFDEYASEILGHVFWFWVIELMRRDLRNRITHEQDAEVPLTTR